MSTRQNHDGEPRGPARSEGQDEMGSGSGPDARDAWEVDAVGNESAEDSYTGQAFEGVLDGQIPDSRNPAIQAAGSEEAAADAARAAARAQGGHASELFARTPGEEGPAPNIPSSLNLDRSASAARAGREGLEKRLAEHTETGPVLTGGDVDADWASANTVGDEAPGGDNPTPDQSVVDDVGKALGVEYQDSEELRGVEKIDDRDRNRWELDPASSEDWEERNRDGRKV